MQTPRSPDDIARLRREYRARAERLADSDRYSLANPAHLFMVEQRQRDTLALFRAQGVTPLAGKHVLEVGCGSGGVLLEYLSAGADADQIHGTDLLLERLGVARTRLPPLPLTCSDARRLPYASGCFDVVLQYTVFSSILDDVIKGQIAREMRRVLRPGGLIVWYDFWINPTNPQTKGIRPDEVQRLFSGCHCTFRRITLAPPITRRLVGISWIACAALEKLGLLNTHYLAAIRPD